MHAFNSSIQELEACGYIERPCLHKRIGGLKVLNLQEITLKTVYRRVCQ